MIAAIVPSDRNKSKLIKINGVFSSVCVKIIDQGFGIYILVLNAHEEAWAEVPYILTYQFVLLFGYNHGYYSNFRYVSSEATTQTTTKASRFNKYFNCNSEKQTQHQPPPNKLKQIPQRHDLRNFRLLICLERT